MIAYHLRQSFVPGEITPEDANRLGCELAKRFTKGNHAYIVCTHIDKAHIHNHVIWNSTALSQTRKFRNFWGSSRAVRRLNDTICIENGCSIVENLFENFTPEGLTMCIARCIISIIHNASYKLEVCVCPQKQKSQKK